MTLTSINPTTEEVLKTFTTLSSTELEKKLKLAINTFSSYRKTTFKERARMMQSVEDILENEKYKFGKMMTMEMGKPLWSAVEEILKCAWVCQYYIENAERFLSDEVIQSNAKLSYIHYQPLGPILAVMPWNFPFWQVFRFAVPALMAGNVGLLKHASNVPQCALAIEDIFRQAGFPDGVFQTLLISSDQVQQLIEDARVRAVTLTGSEPAGRIVASGAGKAIKKSLLELGGSDPFIVMPSSKVKEAANTAVKARTINNGQSCIAAKRFIVHVDIFESFTEMFVEGMKGLKVGDPILESTMVGPLATPAILEELDQQVKKSVELGARILTGGNKLNRMGNFYAPTVLTDIPKNSPAYTDELFGPVAPLFRIKNIDEAIALANDTSFGLGASVWTNDENEKIKFIDELESGLVFINGMVVSDPRLPFGGVKNSGYGRELGFHGIREFVNIKTVWVK